MEIIVSTTAAERDAERFDHCLVEYIWSPALDGATGFQSSFSVFWGNGRTETYKGGNLELASFFSKLGQTGWRITTSVTTSNWILYTLERRL